MMETQMFRFGRDIAVEKVQKILLQDDDESLAWEHWEESRGVRRQGKTDEI